MENHPSILAWRIPWAEEPGGLQSMGSQRIGNDWSDWACTHISVKADAPILWPPDAKSQVIGKEPDAGKDWRQEEKGTTEEEMVGLHHRLNRHEFEQTLGDSEEQGSLVCCGPRGHKELDMTEPLINNNLDNVIPAKNALVNQRILWDPNYRSWEKSRLTSCLQKACVLVGKSGNKHIMTHIKYFGYDKSHEESNTVESDKGVGGRRGVRVLGSEVGRGVLWRTEQLHHRPFRPLPGKTKNYTSQTPFQLRFWMQFASHPSDILAETLIWSCVK